jgi:hypothetical protein
VRSGLRPRRAKDAGPGRVLAVADSGHGVSAVLPRGKWRFINSELTVHFHRKPRDEWICLDAETAINGGRRRPRRLDDDDGVVAHGAQSLRVGPRSA